MNRLYKHNLFSKMITLTLAFVMGGPAATFAKDAPDKIPKNALAKSYGSGWKCNRGFQESEGRCAQIKVPANGYPTKSSYGRVWECLRGYKIANEACVAIKVPSHGYLASYGDQWKCHRGYRRVEDGCAAVRVPANGYLADDDSYGRGWQCKRGFAAIDAGCVAVKLPANAHLDFSGSRWECDRSYEKKQGRCVQR